MALSSDTGLQEKLIAAGNYDAVIAIAKEAGFSISADDLTMAQSEISDEELEGVAGGGQDTVGPWGEKWRVCGTQTEMAVCYDDG